MDKKSIEDEIKSMQPELTDDDCKEFVLPENKSKMLDAMGVWQFLYPHVKDEEELKSECKFLGFDYENALKYKDYCLKQLSNKSSFK